MKPEKPKFEQPRIVPMPGDAAPYENESDRGERRRAWIRSFTEDENTPIGRILKGDPDLKAAVESRMFAVAEVYAQGGVMSEDRVRGEVLKKGREIYLDIMKQREQEEFRRSRRRSA